MAMGVEKGGAVHTHTHTCAHERTRMYTRTRTYTHMHTSCPVGVRHACVQAQPIYLPKAQNSKTHSALPGCLRLVNPTQHLRGGQAKRCTCRHQLSRSVGRDTQDSASSAMRSARAAIYRPCPHAHSTGDGGGGSDDGGGGNGGVGGEGVDSGGGDGRGGDGGVAGEGVVGGGGDGGGGGGGGGDGGGGDGGVCGLEKALIRRGETLK